MKNEAQCTKHDLISNNVKGQQVPTRSHVTLRNSNNILIYDSSNTYNTTIAIEIIIIVQVVNIYLIIVFMQCLNKDSFEYIIYLQKIKIKKILTNVSDYYTYLL